MTEEKLCVPVIIVGAGPVGLVVALELGLRGVRCLVLNDRPQTAAHPKANAIGARSMEHFRRLGLAERIRQAGLGDDHPTDVAYFTGLTGIELGRLNMPSRREARRQARAGEGPWATPEPPHRCSQIYLERELKRRAQDVLSIDLRFGWRCESWTQTTDGVQAQALEAATGRRIVISADYLVGCDGGGSMVRKGAGIELEGESGAVRPFMGGSMFAAYFRARPDPSWLAVRKSWQYWVVHPEVRALFIHVDDNNLFVMHTVLPQGADPATFDVRAVAHRAAGATIPMDILSAVPWTAGFSLVAQRYAAGRVFLAGDAVHLFTPTGGLGMNTGVDDAANLGWKLAAMCQGWGGRRLLESYEIERRPIGQRNVNYAQGFATSVGTVPVSQEIERNSEAGAAERHALRLRLEDHAFREFIIPGIQLGLRYEASPIVVYDGEPAPPDEPNRYSPGTWPGVRAPHLWLANGRALFDRLGSGFTLLRMGAAEKEVSGLQEAAKHRKVPLSVVDLPGDRARDLYGRDLVLLRPDQHVAWRGNSAPDDPLELIDRTRGASR